jgi:hypothetical protein
MSVSPEVRALPPLFDYEKIALPENVSLTFRLAAHAHANDLPEAEQLGRDFRSADAIIIESVSDGRDPMGPLNKISQGNFKEYQSWRQAQVSHDMRYGSWTKAMFSALYGTRVPVITVDVDRWHPSISEFKKADDVFYSANLKARTDEDLLAIKSLKVAVFTAVQHRDQFILNSLAPRIDQLTDSHRTLKQKRNEQSIKVDVYYGSMHRSLLDALVSKATIAETPGFRATLHPDSMVDETNEGLYAYYLRGCDLPDDLFLQDVARNFLATYLLTYGQVEPDIPIEQLNAKANAMITDKNFAEVKQLSDEIASGGTARLWQP